MRKHVVALLLGLASSVPCLSAAPKAAGPVVDDLTVAVVRHEAVCPLPTMGPCVFKNPVGMSYNVLTPGINIENRGDSWVTDFSSIKDVKNKKVVLRVMTISGDLHEIEVLFSNNGRASKAKRAAKKNGKAAAKKITG